MIRNPVFKLMIIIIIFSSNVKVIAQNNYNKKKVDSLILHKHILLNSEIAYFYNNDNANMIDVITKNVSKIFFETYKKENRIFDEFETREEKLDRVAKKLEDLNQQFLNRKILEVPFELPTYIVNNEVFPVRIYIGGSSREFPVYMKRNEARLFKEFSKGATLTMEYSHKWDTEQLRSQRNNLSHKTTVNKLYLVKEGEIVYQFNLGKREMEATPKNGMVNNAADKIRRNRNGAVHNTFGQSFNVTNIRMFVNQDHGQPLSIMDMEVVGKGIIKLEFNNLRSLTILNYSNPKRIFVKVKLRNYDILEGYISFCHIDANDNDHIDDVRIKSADLKKFYFFD